ncbi:eCIS core domain-containing protein [Nostoc sp.]|uniref:eCIS core domain-containing protein n=2 Tax=Nostoc sp. TaxID=1180 RepID=UPI002FEED8AD
MQSTDNQEELALSNSAFSKDFSQVPISTTKPQEFQPRNSQSHLMPHIQAKLTIGEPGDRYEQEADRVASEVVQRINAPASAGQSVQRQEEAEEEIQAKPEITSLQRRSKPEAELQAKLTLQRREAIAGGEASPDLESTINRVRGSGQPLEAGLQQSMGQAMRADFSGVKVHTDAQSDQLNQSIQAKAFTTGQDVFFRQGAYEPGSREGQELIAHELTHVMQQNEQSRLLSTKKIQRGADQSRPSQTNDRFIVEGSGGNYNVVLQGTREQVSSIESETRQYGNGKVLCITHIETNMPDKLPGVGYYLVHQVAKEAVKKKVEFITVGNAARTATPFYLKCGFSADPDKLAELNKIEGLTSAQIELMSFDNLIATAVKVINTTGATEKFQDVIQKIEQKIE